MYMLLTGELASNWRTTKTDVLVVYRWFLILRNELEFSNERIFEEFDGIRSKIVKCLLTTKYKTWLSN